MHEFELRFAQIDISENSNCANIYRDSRYNGWYLVSLETKEQDKDFIDTVIRFRMPSPIKLYGDVLRNFTQEERKAGLHRMLIGKDLQDEVKRMLEESSDDLSNLTQEEVTNLLNKMKKIVVFDCNKIPYLHIRTEAKDSLEYTDQIKKFILGLPNYLEIFYSVLNETTSIAEAAKESQDIIFNELLDIKEE